MTGLTDLVGILLNSGMISSGDARIGNAMGSSDLKQVVAATNRSDTHRLGSLTKRNAGEGGKRLPTSRSQTLVGMDSLVYVLLGGDSGVSTKGSLLGEGAIGILASLAFQTFKNINKQPAGMQKMIGSNEIPITSVPLGALKHVLLAGSSSGEETIRASLEGDAMAMLTSLVFQAFNRINRQPAGRQAGVGGNEIPLGLRSPVNAEEEVELEQTATLVLKGMINAVKADSQIGNEKIQKIICHIRESDNDDYIQKLIFEEMQLPLNLDSLVNEIPNEMVAAQVYAASLFAIEVDTPAEREYLEQFVQRTGLDAGVAQQLQNAVGVN